MQRELEPLLGASLDGVRIHTGPAAAGLAESEQAAAFTLGRDIVFGEGRFRSGTERGRTLLAHELAHTVQQRMRRPMAPASAAENEARWAGTEAARGRPAPIRAAAPVRVQKADEDDPRKQPKPGNDSKSTQSKKKRKTVAPAKPWNKKRTIASTAATASNRDRAMTTFKPDQQRRIEILEQFGEGAEKAGKDRIAKSPVNEEGVARTRRKESSEKKRHVDPMKRGSGHHGFPQYLGGKFEQALIGLGEDLHYLYHQELDLVEKLPRKLGSKYYKNLTPPARQALFRRLIEHAQRFDKKYSTLYPDKRTRIAAALKRGIREAGYEVPSTTKTTQAPKAPNRARDGARKAPTREPSTKSAQSKAKSTPRTKAPPGKEPATKAKGPKSTATTKPGSKPGVKHGGNVAPPPKLSKPPKIPKLRGMRAPRIPRVRVAGRMAGRGLGAVAFLGLTAWIGAKLDNTEAIILRDIDKLGPAIQLRIEEQAWIIQRLVEENPWDPVYANITVGLRYLKLIDPDDIPTDDYMGLRGLSVAVSHAKRSGYEPGPIDAGFGWSSHIDHLTFSLPIELESVVEHPEEPPFWARWPVGTEPEAEQELPPIPMRLPE